MTVRSLAMSRRDKYQAAYAKGELLQLLAVPSECDYEERAQVIAELHNGGVIDFLGACCSDELDTLSNTSVFRLYSVLDRALPQMECAVEEASAACDKLYQKVEGDLAAGSFYTALQKWLEKDLQRVEEGLALIRAKGITGAGNTQSILLAGAVHDRERSAKEAIKLSRETDDGIRVDAIRSLGMIPLEAEDEVLPVVLNRLEEIIDSPGSDADAGFAAQAALRILERIGEPVVSQIERLLVKACRNPSPATLRAVASQLTLHPKSFSEAILDAAVEALQRVGADDSQTIECIDRALYRWDLDQDRTRVLRLLKGLLGRSDGVIEIEKLESFRQRFRECSGDVQAWYIVSLLLTGNHGRGNAVTRLMGSASQGSPEGFDIDLSGFSLEAVWIPYLVRKILGYCFLNSVHLSRLLLSCLRAITNKYRAEVEELVFDYFLINYPGAIENLKAGLNKTDPARVSVKRLSDRIAAYLDAIKDIRPCEAFQSSQRHRALHFQQQEAMMEAAQKKAQKESLFLNILPTATMLYGTRIISYTYPAGGQRPVREERALSRHTFAVELPRTEQIDPVGYHYAMTKFRLERPPS